MSTGTKYKLGCLIWSVIFFFVLLMRLEVPTLYELRPALNCHSDYQLKQLQLNYTLTVTAAATTNSCHQHSYKCRHIYLQRLVSLYDFK